MWVGCCVRQAGVDSSLSNEPASATKKPSSSGLLSAGLPLKKSRARQGYDHLGRRSGLLSAADGGTHLGSAWADARIAGAVDSRSPLVHQRDHCRWATVPTSASHLL